MCRRIYNPLRLKVWSLLPSFGFVQSLPRCNKQDINHHNSDCCLISKRSSLVAGKSWFVDKKYGKHAQTREDSKRRASVCFSSSEVASSICAKQAFQMESTTNEEGFFSRSNGRSHAVTCRRFSSCFIPNKVSCKTNSSTQHCECNRTRIRQDHINGSSSRNAVLNLETSSSLNMVSSNTALNIASRSSSSSSCEIINCCDNSGSKI
mmetsp:Transcript_28693/g.43363  ORF Transcript_28693/g.43363 Transcript_28693/m.43363 type:complete len:207 (-) Transcript_28693:370-990(-)